MQIYAVRIKDKLEDNLFTNLLHIIESEKRRKISKFLKWEDSQRALFAELLIRYIAIKSKSLENKDICFFINEYGKPYFKNIYDFHFNLAHSGNWVICGVDNVPIGVDVEKIEPIDCLSISKNYFSDEECRNLREVNPSKRKSYFYEIWTLKESYIKAIGKGLYLPLDSFTIIFDSKKEIRLKINGDFVDNIFFKQYNIDNYHKMAVCAENIKFPDHPKIIELEELISSLL